ACGRLGKWINEEVPADFADQRRLGLVACGRLGEIRFYFRQTCLLATSLQVGLVACGRLWLRRFGGLRRLEFGVWVCDRRESVWMMDRSRISPINLRD